MMMMMMTQHLCTVANTPSRWLEWCWCWCTAVLCIFDDVTLNCRDVEMLRCWNDSAHFLSTWLSTFLMTSLPVQNNFSMTLQNSNLSLCHSEYVGFWTSHFNILFDAVMWPMTRQDQWYHSRPDRPTGTLRVDFTRKHFFSQNLLMLLLFVRQFIEI